MTTCAVCHNQMVKKRGELDLRIGGMLYLARNVAYEECAVCGEKALAPSVSQQLFEQITRHDFVVETVAIPVLTATYA